MTVEIMDGRQELYQWDTGRRLQITDDDGVINFVHFEDLSDADNPNAYVVQVVGEEDGRRYAPIPNVCLANESTKLVAYTVDVDATGSATTRKNVFKVIRRQKPADYTMPPDTLVTLESVLVQTGNAVTNANSASELAQKWATKMDGPVADDDYSAKYYAKEAYTTAHNFDIHVGTDADAPTADTVYGKLSKFTEDAIDAIGRSDDEDDGARGQAISALEEYAISGDDSLKRKLYNFVNGQDGLAEGLSSHEKALEGELDNYALGENKDGEGGLVYDMKEEINKFTTGTNSDQMFGKLDGETQRQKSIIAGYAHSEEVRKKVDDYATSATLKNKIDGYAKDSVDNYVDTVAGPSINNYVGKPTDSPEATTIMGALNAKKEEISKTAGDYLQDLSEAKDAVYGEFGDSLGQLNSALNEVTETVDAHDALIDETSKTASDNKARLHGYDFRKVDRNATFVLDGDGEANLKQMMDSVEAYPQDAIMLSLEPITPTASAHNFGIRGQIACDDTYLYVCTAENQWKKIPLTNL